MESKSERMLIIDPEIINKGEKNLVYSILTSVDTYPIQKLFKKKFGLTIREKLELTEGDVVVYNNQVAYSLHVEAVATFSLLLDKMGHFKGFATPNDIFLSNAEETDSEKILTDFDLIKLKEAEFLDALAATIDKKKIVEFLQNITKLRSNGIIVYKQGDITIFNGHVTYRLTFDFETKLSLFLDRKGKYLGFSVQEESHRMPINGDE
jgi:hypothetical protein